MIVHWTIEDAFGGCIWWSKVKNDKFIMCIPVAVTLAQRQNLPDLSETSSKPIRVSVGDDINIDCVVKNRNNLTILWKYVNGSVETLLAANQVIVSDDKRLAVIHESCMCPELESSDPTTWTL